MIGEPLLLGLDIGTSRTKALLIGRGGDELALSTTPTPWEHGVELSVGRLQSMLQSLLSGLGDDRGRVVSVGIAGIAESGAPLDRAGRALAPVIAWHDPRGDEVVARLAAHFGENLPRWIGQPLRTVSSVAKLGWLVEQGLTDVSCWLGVPELCLHGLTGSRATEYSLAARTGCYDVGRRRYLPEVAQVAGIGSGVFPPVQAAGAVMGRISPDGAAWSGLPIGIPVTLAGHDHLAGLVGSGAQPDDLVNSVGSAESVLAAAPDPPDIDRALSGRVAVTVMPGGEGWALLAGAARAGIIVSSVARRLGGSPEELDGRARGAGLVDAGCVLDGGELPEAPAGAVWNGLLHALSARTWEAVGRITEVSGPPTRLVVFGGGSRSGSWLGHKARTGWLPVWRSVATEAVARGAALHAGVAAGWWPSTAAPRTVCELVHAGQAGDQPALGRSEPGR